METRRRIERAFKQRIYLLREWRRSQRYEIAGTTNNYMVHLLESERKCTCPDNTHRGRDCKHIYFALFRIHRLDIGKWCEDPKGVYQAWRENPLTTPASEPKDDSLANLQDLKRKRRDTNDECPICYESLDDAIRACVNCAYQFHNQCIDIWLTKVSKSTSCPMCRGRVDKDPDPCEHWTKRLKRQQRSAVPLS